MYLFFVGAILTSGVISAILWVLFAILALGFLLQLSTRLESPWCRVHYPMMSRLAKAKGLEWRQAQAQGRPADSRRIALLLVQSAFPGGSESEVRSTLDAMLRKFGSDGDIRGIAELLAGRPVPDAERHGIELGVRDHFASSQGRDTFVVAIIAELVERLFGVGERARYLLASIQGRAR